jgi:hypothetical protein
MRSMKVTSEWKKQKPLLHIYGNPNITKKKLVEC